MNAILSETQTDRNGSTGAVRAIRPRADIFETNEAWLVVLDLPGADERTTEISVEKQVLTVKAAVEEFAPEGFECVYTECPPHRYERSFRLPEQVDPASIDASVRNGVLRITLPKTKEAQPQQIQVKAG